MKRKSEDEASMFLKMLRPRSVFKKRSSSHRGYFVTFRSVLLLWIVDVLLRRCIFLLPHLIPARQGGKKQKQTRYNNTSPAEVECQVVWLSPVKEPTCNKKSSSKKIDKTDRFNGWMLGKSSYLQQVVRAWFQTLQNTWECHEPDWVAPCPRFW